MHIAYLINQYPKVSHSFIRREIQALERLGVKVTRVSVRQPEHCPDTADQSEALLTQFLFSPPAMLTAFLGCLVTRPAKMWRALSETFWLSRSADRGLLTHAAYFLEACQLTRLLNQQSITHVHAHFGTNPAAVALITKRLAGITYSFTVHGPEEFDRPLALKLNRKIAAAEFVVAISSFGRSQLMRWCSHEQWSKLQVIRCGLDSSFWSTQVAPGISESPTLLCVGRLCEQKGQLLLIDAVAQLKQRGMDVRLVLAGDGELRTEIEKRIRALGVEDAIEITGWLNGEQVKERLLHCRAVVLPSFAEGLPVVLMEAFALRRPVVTTYVAGIPELVRDLDNGWLIPAGSLEHLVEALATVLNSPSELLQRFGARGRETVKAKHDVDHAANLLKNCFSIALQGDSGEI
jgi:colanic acid/amylovoran biosynthesis glycosyltransferase